MLVTAYIMLNTTTLYTPADTHVTDMQLQQLGTDTLAMMDTMNSSGQPESDLERDVRLSDNVTFNSTFNAYLNAQYIPDSRPLQWNATIYYYDENDANNPVKSYNFAQSNETMTGREHFVMVTKWVHIEDNSTHPSVLPQRDRVVLMEVLLWRG